MTRDTSPRRTITHIIQHIIIIIIIVIHGGAKTLFLFHRYRFWGLRCYLPAEVSSRHLQVPRGFDTSAPGIGRKRVRAKGFGTEQNVRRKGTLREQHDDNMWQYTYIYIYIESFPIDEISPPRPVNTGRRRRDALATLFVFTKKNNKENPKIEDVRKSNHANIVGNFRTHAVRIIYGGTRGL